MQRNMSPNHFTRKEKKRGRNSDLKTFAKRDNQVGVHSATTIPLKHSTGRGSVSVLWLKKTGGEGGNLASSRGKGARYDVVRFFGGGEEGGLSYARLEKKGGN